MIVTCRWLVSTRRRRRQSLNARVTVAREADTKVWAPEAVDAAEAERFWAQVDATVAEMQHGVGPVRRLRASLSTKSLRRKD